MQLKFWGVCGIYFKDRGGAASWLQALPSGPWQTPSPFDSNPEEKGASPPNCVPRIRFIDIFGTFGGRSSKFCSKNKLY